MRNNNFKRSVISTINYLIRKAKLIKLFLFNLANFLKENKFIIIDFIATCIIFFLFKKIGLFNFTSTSTAVSVFTTIASILASIVGIVIAILLVAFELQYKTFGVFVYRKFFKDSTFIFLFWAFISTIILSIIATVNVEKYFKNIDALLFNSPLLLFIFCLLILYPSFKRIISSAEPKSEIERNIKVLLENLKNLRKHETWNSNPKIENIVSELQEVFSNALKENDRETVKIILSKITQTTKSLFENDPNLEPEYLVHIIKILDLLSYEAFTKNSEFALRENLGTTKSLRGLVKTHNLNSSILIDLNNFIKEILWNSIKKDFYSVCSEGFNMITMNLHDDANIGIYTGKNNQRNSTNEIKEYFNEIYIETTYLSPIKDLTERAIELERIDVIKDGFLSFQNVVLAIILSDGFSSKTIVTIIDKSFLVIKELVYKCIDKGLFNMVSETLFITFSYIYHLFKNEKALYINSVGHFGDLLIGIAMKDAIDISFTKTGLNCLWGIGEACLDHLDKQVYFNSMNIVIETFDGIAKLIKDKKEKIYNVNAYISIYYHLKSFLDKMHQKNIHSVGLEKKISSSLEKFNDIKA